MIVLVNYADVLFRKAQRLNTWTALHIAKFDKVYEYNDSKIDVDFKEKNKAIFKNKKGNGLYIWKPYCILKTLEKVNYGDIVFYCDAGSFFCKNVRNYLINEVNDIWVSNIPFIEKQFSQKKAFDLMECNKEEFRETNQIQGGFVGIRKTDETVSFVSEWLHYCEDIRILSPSCDNEEEDICFIANRDDQTVLSLLCKKKGIVAYPDPTQYGKVPEEYMRDSRYIFKIPAKTRKRKLFIILHRTGDIDVKICLKQILVAILPRKMSLMILKVVRKKV